MIRRSNPDEGYRQAERGEDLVAALAARLRAGEVSQERVAYAAALGYGPALELVEPAEVSPDSRNCAFGGVKLIGRVEAVRWAADCAEDALRKFWTHDDNSPWRAVAAARAWADTPEEELDIFPICPVTRSAWLAAGVARRASTESWSGPSPAWSAAGAAAGAAEAASQGASETAARAALTSVSLAATAARAAAAEAGCESREVMEAGGAAWNLYTGWLAERLCWGGSPERDEWVLYPGPCPNPAPRFVVRSPEQGRRVIEHKDITANFKKALRWKPKQKLAILLPCAQTKPFPDSPSHNAGYLPAIQGKKADVFVVSEPLGVVPYDWSRTYPNNSYDFPPKHLRGAGRELLAKRIAEWFAKVGAKYSRIVLALPDHHMRLVDEALDLAGKIKAKIVRAGIGECLDAGACPTGHYRATSEAYRGFLKRRANPDEGYRLAERGDDPVAALAARLRAGEVTRERVAYAAALGYGPAGEVAEGFGVSVPVVTSDRYHAFSLVAWRALGHRHSVLLLCDLAEEAAERSSDWRQYPGDPERLLSERLLAAVRAWVDSPTGESRESARRVSNEMLQLQRELTAPGRCAVLAEAQMTSGGTMFPMFAIRIAVGEGATHAERDKIMASSLNLLVRHLCWGPPSQLSNPPQGDGDCYSAALEALALPWSRFAGDESARLVHATVTGQGPIAGVAHGHAWIEYDRRVVPGPHGIMRFAFDGSQGREIELPADAYRRLGQARDVFEYTAKEARGWATRTKHYGPWKGPGAVGPI